MKLVSESCGSFSTAQASQQQSEHEAGRWLVQFLAPVWCGGTGTSICYGYENSMTLWPLSKKSPSERFWFQSWVSFRVLNHFFLDLHAVFLEGRPSKLELWLTILWSHSFPDFVGGFCFRKKTSRIFFSVDTKLHPIGGLGIGSFATKSKIPGLLNET